MSKVKKMFVCEECGYDTPKWHGKCPQCDIWNSFKEIHNAVNKNEAKNINSSDKKPVVSIGEVEYLDEKRIMTRIKELDRVLGGGIVSGTVTLIGGSPGIGKSTLLMQVSDKVAAERGSVLYVSGEESLPQIKLRADRLGVNSEDLFLSTETEVNNICEQIGETKPSLAVVDSIQTVYDCSFSGQPGSISQIRQCCGVLMQAAKTLDIPIFLVGHITKGGYIAGPKVLEHIVDIVLYFEGDEQHVYRILRAAKNRFGSTNEIGVFEMQQSGLADISSPSTVFLTERPERVIGSQVIPVMKGSRPIFLEIQSLISEGSYGNPRRLANGIEFNRLLLMLAVLEKRAGLHFSGCDAYANVAGGMRIDDPAADLGLCMSLASSFRDAPVRTDTFVFGEIGLTGEVRGVSQSELRLREGENLGFKRCIVPKKVQDQFEGMSRMELIGVNSISDALDFALLEG